MVCFLEVNKMSSCVPMFSLPHITYRIRIIYEKNRQNKNL